MNNYFKEPNSDSMNVDDIKPFPKDNDKNKNIQNQMSNQYVNPILNQNVNSVNNQNVIPIISNNDPFKQEIGNNFPVNYGIQYQSQNRNSLHIENNNNNNFIDIGNNQKKDIFSNSYKNNLNPYSQQFDDGVF